MGASAAVDAACASSLVAVHLDRQAIFAGESRVAIVGGENVCLSPALFHMLGAAGALSTDGICISFDDDAQGYARGEGAAVFVLKHLSDAILDGDNVLATLKGSAIAQDGKTNGIMAPNPKAQRWSSGGRSWRNQRSQSSHGREEGTRPTTSDAKQSQHQGRLGELRLTCSSRNN
jgi:6-methylsalicylic acid synthase